MKFIAIRRNKINKIKNKISKVEIHLQLLMNHDFGYKTVS